MILKIKRTKYAGTREELVVLNKDNDLIKECSLEKQEEFFEFKLNNNDEEFSLKVPKDYSKFSTITKNNNEIGKIESDATNTVISTDYCWNMAFENRTFKLYEVGFGSKGLYLVIKEAEKTIAIISSSMIVKNFQDSYELFIEDQNDSVIVILCCIYWNLYRGTNFTLTGGIMNKTLYTTSEKLRNTMDYSFIEELSKKENYTPSNMYKKATFLQIVGWTMFIAFIICLAIMLIIKY